MTEHSAYSKMEMDTTHTTPARGAVGGKQSLMLSVLVTLVIFVLFVMIFVIFHYQERKFTDLESSLLTHNSTLNSLNSDLKHQLQENRVVVENRVTELKTVISSLSSYVDLYTTRLNIQLNSGTQMKKLSDLQTLINNLGSSLSSVSSQLETKLQDQTGQQAGQFTEMKKILEQLNSSVSQLTHNLHNTVVQQDVKLSESKTSLSAQHKLIQDLDQRLTAALSDISTKVESGSKSEDSQIRMLMEKLSSSVQSLSSKLQNTDQRLTAALIDIKTKLENISKAEVSCKSGWIQYRSWCYLFSGDKLNWHEARDYCKSQNALLLKLETKDEWVFVTGRSQQDHHWVGLTDELTGQWRWADDTPYVMKTDDWEPGQPDDWKDHGMGEGGEDCGHLKPSGKLNDAPCVSRFNYICKA